MSLHDEVSAAIKRAYGLGQLYWQQADSESYRENAKSDATRARFDELLDRSTCAVVSGLAAKDAEIARLREALEKIANPFNISKTYHSVAIATARAALAPVEVGK